jgi:hypothetical protein
VRQELIESAKTLPSTFSKILEVLTSDPVSQAVEYYTVFVKECHTEDKVVRHIQIEISDAECRKMCYTTLLYLILTVFFFV